MAAVPLESGEQTVSFSVTAVWEQRWWRPAWPGYAGLAIAIGRYCWYTRGSSVPMYDRSR